MQLKLHPETVQEYPEKNKKQTLYVHVEVLQDPSAFPQNYI